MKAPFCASWPTKKKLKTVEIKAIIQKIRNGQTFSALAPDGSFSIAIDDYVPFVCAAIHNGGNLREDLRGKCALNKFERWYEEDPFTGLFISALPIRLVCHASRYEFDLNRHPQEAIYDEAWGKQVWQQSLSKEEKNVSIKRHNNFYVVLDELLKVLTKKHGACLVYDIHSFNFRRIEKESIPVFNVGTTEILSKKFRPHINSWLDELQKIKLPGISTTAKENDVFFGRGHFLKHITKKFKNVLVLATEVKKIYCDELSGDEYPEVIDAMREGLKRAVLTHASAFIRDQKIFTLKKKNSLLSGKIEPAILEVDQQLFRLCKNLELLDYVNPINALSEKRKFFASHFKSEPQFRYRPLKLDASELKRQLYSVPVEKIRDIGIQQLYKSIIESQAAQIDMLSERGSRQFLYHSLRYFGEPTDGDIANANWLFHCPDARSSSSPQSSDVYGSEEAKVVLEKFVKDYGFSCKVEISRSTSAKALYIPSQKTLRIRKDAVFTKREALALAHHEVGIHALTTENAHNQPLKIFQTGLPVNTYAQEGLAIFSEYLSGNMSVKRLREIALRVIAIQHMIVTLSFKETFALLVDDYQQSPEAAFYACVRVYRSGGFTKDYLYLRGFRDVLELYKAKKPLEPLLIGKTSLEYRVLIQEMIERGMLNQPKHLPNSFLKPSNEDPLIDYVVSGIR